MNLDNDYDEEGNNIVPCPICLNVHCPSKEGGECPEEDEFAKAMTNKTPPQEQQENVNTPDFGTKLESIKHIGDTVDGKMVCREDCPSVTHMNTPETEWEKLANMVIRMMEGRYNSNDARKADVKNAIKSSFSSRDTYWKEKIEELELSCVDDRLLGKTDEYLDGYNTSTERWREQRDTLLENLNRGE